MNRCLTTHNFFLHLLPLVLLLLDCLVSSRALAQTYTSGWCYSKPASAVPYNYIIKPQNKLLYFNAPAMSNCVIHIDGSSSASTAYATQVYFKSELTNVDIIITNLTVKGTADNANDPGRIFFGGTVSSSNIRVENVNIFTFKTTLARAPLTFNKDLIATSVDVRNVVARHQEAFKQGFAILFYVFRDMLDRTNVSLTNCHFNSTGDRPYGVYILGRVRNGSSVTVADNVFVSSGSVVRFVKPIISPETVIAFRRNKFLVSGALAQVILISIFQINHMTRFEFADNKIYASCIDSSNSISSDDDNGNDDDFDNFYQHQRKFLFETEATAMIDEATRQRNAKCDSALFIAIFISKGINRTNPEDTTQTTTTTLGELFLEQNVLRVGYFYHVVLVFASGIEGVATLAVANNDVLARTSCWASDACTHNANLLYVQETLHQVRHVGFQNNLLLHETFDVRLGHDVLPRQSSELDGVCGKVSASGVVAFADVNAIQDVVNFSAINDTLLSRPLRRSAFVCDPLNVIGYRSRDRVRNVSMIKVRESRVHVDAAAFVLEAMNIILVNASGIGSAGVELESCSINVATNAVLVRGFQSEIRMHSLVLQGFGTNLSVPVRVRNSNVSFLSSSTSFFFPAAAAAAALPITSTMPNKRVSMITIAVLMVRTQWTAVAPHSVEEMLVENCHQLIDRPIFLANPNDTLRSYKTANGVVTMTLRFYVHLLEEGVLRFVHNICRVMIYVAEWSRKSCSYSQYFHPSIHRDVCCTLE